jgi:hypothetical protein
MVRRAGEGRHPEKRAVPHESEFLPEAFGNDNEVLRKVLYLVCDNLAMPVHEYEGVVVRN